MTAVTPFPDRIQGRHFPRVHPDWCREALHGRRWESAASDIMAGLDDIEIPTAHEETVGSGWWPAVHRAPLQAAPTRPDQGTWEIEIRQDDKGPGHVTPDHVVRLTIDAPTVELLPGEARSLAAVLTRAADLLEFDH